ncbi:protein of unknown function, DUF1830 [Gloeomargarita lithophora Alchichica-D10]|uniref:DUF1830 domain-containing protein n=1 Tax=Gloeomargarita lithophora Alchichica-D10 TaxID=1188229 RepID=A0A1J0AG74_9CYAN|nr:DUF1830 domain-containing protein [Gloeomargarita lithophora]APB34940.1 protein of unknown function, DUF1830 [Gloeomargarita lithophora Alchichica-D10]
MSQVFDPLPVTATDCLVCCYVNATSQIQVVRITDVPNWYFERVVFPGQRLMFTTPDTAHLEVHVGMMAALDDTIPCRELQITGVLAAPLLMTAHN